MTREECIQKIKDLDIENNMEPDWVIYDDLHEIVIEYNPKLAYFFEDYYKEDYVWQDVLDTSRGLEDLWDNLINIDRFDGVYYAGICGWETANLYRLRDDILSELERNIHYTERVPLPVNVPEKEIWYEEDDNFITGNK